MSDKAGRTEKKDKPPAVFFVALGGAGICLILYLYFDLSPRSESVADWFQLATLSLLGVVSVVFFLWNGKRKR